MSGLNISCRPYNLKGVAPEVVVSNNASITTPGQVGTDGGVKGALFVVLGVVLAWALAA